MTKTKTAAAILVILAIGLWPAQAYAQSTIDAGAKPLIVGFFALLTLAFAAGAWLFTARGIRTRRIARESVTWPVADARILSSGIRTERRNPTGGAGDGYEVFIPEIRYAYTAGGAQREGNVIRPGIEQFGYASAEMAQLQLAPYATGATVPVRYDPADPASATLEAAGYGGGRNIFGGTMLALLAAGMLFAMIAAALTPSAP